MDIGAVSPSPPATWARCVPTSDRAAAKLGKGAEFLITAKGQEPPAHMPQVKRSLALIYAVNPFGSDHESSDHDSTYEADSYEAFADRYGSLGLNKPLSALSLASDKVEFVHVR